MKEFYGSVSFSGRISFTITAENEEDAKNKLFESINEMDLKSNNSDVAIAEIEWELIDQEPRGNVAAPYVSSLDIYEEE